MKLPTWLWPKPRSCNCEIERLESSIMANDLAIEATKPIVEEAVRRSDDEIYRLRAKTGAANRRIAREGALLQDLSEGWGRGHG